MASRDFYQRQTRLQNTSPEWAELEYSLQLCLGSTAPVVKEVYSVSSAHMTTAFDRRAQNLLVLDSWLDCTALSGDNRLEEVCSRGFKVSSNGLVFTTGSVKLQDQLAYGRVYEYLLVKVAIGRSYAINVETLTEKRPKLPAGYDSIYLFHSENDAAVYQHDYLLFEGAQALPCFIVRFELDPNREEALKTHICDICQESQATVFCEADDACLCADCDEEHHTRGNKLMQRHKRILIQDKPKRFGFCQFHPDMAIDYYCTVCRTPLCTNCKMVGSHSTPETHSHPLIKVFEAYQRALVESREVDPLLDQKKSALTQLLARVEERIEQVKRVTEEVEARIYKVLENALLQLQEEHQKKISALLSVQLELKRQTEEVSWVEGFLKYQQEVLSPALFMVSWGRHLRHRSDVRTSADAAELQLPQADLRLEGALQVVSEAALHPKPSMLDSLSSGQSTPTPTTVSSKFRSQLFSRHQLTTPPSGRNQMIPSKPYDLQEARLNLMTIAKAQQLDDVSEEGDI